MSARILLITGGDSAGHPFPETAPLTRELLATTFDVVEENNLEGIKDEDIMNDFRAVVLHGRFPDRDEDAEIGIEKLVHLGKGLVVIHIASDSFIVSMRWRNLVGRVWDYDISEHPPIGSFQVDIIDANHWITYKGATGFELSYDERYQELVIGSNTEIRDLAAATINGRTEPVAWVMDSVDSGRVFHTTLGHEHSTYNNSGFQKLLIRGVIWATGN